MPTFDKLTFDETKFSNSEDVTIHTLNCKEMFAVGFLTKVKSGALKKCTVL